MKRKIIRHGPISLAICLPMKWVRQQNLKPGEELSVEEKEDLSLVVTSQQKELEKKEIVVDAKNLEPIIRKLLAGLYKTGYDKITIRDYSVESLKAIQHVLSISCIGFEVIEQTKEKIVIEAVSSIESEELEKILRRFFQSISDNISDLKKDLEQGDHDDLNNIILRDWQINRYADYLRRAINKQIFPHPKLGPFFMIIEHSEKLADLYKELAMDHVKNKKKLSKEYAKAMHEANQYFQLFCESYYSYSREKLIEFIARKKKIESMLEKLKEKEEDILALKFIVRHIFEFNSSLISLKE